MSNAIIERFIAFRRIPLKIVAITALASWALQIGAIIQGQPLWVIALFTLIPWIPLVLIEGIWKYQHYGWLALFAVITALQVGHLGEHAFQVTQLTVLNGTVTCPPPTDSFANYQRAVDRGMRSPDQGPTGRDATTVIAFNRTGENAGLPLMNNGRFKEGPPACGVFGRLDFETIHLI